MSGERQIISRRFLISGRVQGVGFRPFVYNLAQRLGITGSVQNRIGDVEITAQGDSGAMAAFAQALIDESPAIARPQLRLNDPIAPLNHNRFVIAESATQAATTIHVPPDYFCCPQCLEEIDNPHDRRYRYPFTNCTQCGPRYTLINALPYDRPNTSMADFPLCANCQAEYSDPTNRRFHAEPIACPTCGPRLFIEYENKLLESEAALQQTVALLRQGEIVAVQGIGGFHLLCDATDAAVVAKLRLNKVRPDKPLAVMFPHPDTDPQHWLEKNCYVSGDERAALFAPDRPIVLLQRQPESELPNNIAPGLNEIGALLPYSPLHHLILGEFGKPLVATSGNLHGEPVLTDPDEARKRLQQITPHILWHNRPIVRPADDSVLRTSHGRIRPLRLGRGISPLEWELPFALEEPVIAVGAHMKLTVALAWDNRLVVSPHIADMGSRRSQLIFEQVIDDLQRLYRVNAKHIVCDRHPGYATSRWASQQKLPHHPVAHHHAHAAAVYGEYHCQHDILVFSWDGTGLGMDNTLWGGETFFGQPGKWQRVAHLRPFLLPGGDKVAQRPWQSAAALCWKAGIPLPESLPITSDDRTLLMTALDKQLNTVQSSSMGRLFDAASALIDVAQQCSFDGHAPMLFEAAAQNRTGQPWDITFTESNDTLLLDWQPWLSRLRDDSQLPQQRAADFHTTLAHAIVQIAQRMQTHHPCNQVGLCGGVFQNRLLTEQTATLLQAAGFEVLIPAIVPCNDAAISFGQVMEFGYSHSKGQ